MICEIKGCVNAASVEIEPMFVRRRLDKTDNWIGKPVIGLDLPDPPNPYSAHHCRYVLCGRHNNRGGVEMLIQQLNLLHKL